MAQPPPFRRGQIWYSRLPTEADPLKRRPIVIVSHDTRNLNEKATTVLAVPLTTSIRKIPTRVSLSSSQTGLTADSQAAAENITVVLKTSLQEKPTRATLSETRLREISECVMKAMGFVD